MCTICRQVPKDLRYEGYANMFTQIIFYFFLQPEHVKQQFMTCLIILFTVTKTWCFSNLWIGGECHCNVFNMFFCFFIKYMTNLISPENDRETDNLVWLSGSTNWYEMTWLLFEASHWIKSSKNTATPCLSGPTEIIQINKFLDKWIICMQKYVLNGSRLEGWVSGLDGFCCILNMTKTMSSNDARVTTWTLTKSQLWTYSVYLHVAQTINHWLIFLTLVSLPWYECGTSYCFV